MDLSLYLVTARNQLPVGKDYFESLEEALKGGVTVVQVREKTAETAEFLDIARRTKDLCDKYNVPVLINDRIDIALAIHAHGVHLGQLDMPISVARKLLPPSAIIGLSVNTVEEALQARANGADYLGIGSIFPTSSKNLTAPVLGVRGAARILEALEGSEIKAVAIGGIKSTNVLRVLHGTVASTHSRTLNGVAVISDIVASQNPAKASRTLCTLVRAFLDTSVPGPWPLSSGITVIQRAAAIFSAIKETNPLVHQITNNVVINQSANATLALGASPIMATSVLEMEDLCKIPGALLINIGTLEDTEGMFAAGKPCSGKLFVNATNEPQGTSLIYTESPWFSTQWASEQLPVASKFATAGLLNHWQVTVIKGNAGEIGALAGNNEALSHGVDSLGSGFSNPAAVVRDLARRERCIVVLTGAVDWISDGHTVVRLENGHPILGNITGSGCMVGTAIATCCAAASIIGTKSYDSGKEDGQLFRGDMLGAAVAGVLAITIASEMAAARPDVQGPGTFVGALIDEISHLSKEAVLSKAKVTTVA